MIIRYKLLVKKIMINLPHISVLGEEFLSFFQDRPLKTFVDCTLGAGGHSALILEKHPEIERLIGLDQDLNALQIAKMRLLPWKDKIEIVQSNFEHLEEVLQKLRIFSVDGIFLDIGVSSMQLDINERGFSFLREGPLDMRMNPDEDISAEVLVNSFRQEELEVIFRDLGEERHYRRAAKAIVEARRKKRIETTTELAEVIAKVLPRRGKLHPATQVFQALRLKVNRELEVLREVLPQAIKLLAPGGRLGVISFHSLEDRIVKELFRSQAKEDASLKILTKKPLIASRQEMRQNPRSRSAKLRFLERSM